jgi:hypothetical protein
MNSEQNIIDNNVLQEVEDNSGLAEMQQAIDEIEKLKNEQQEITDSEEPPEVEVDKESEESLEQEEGDDKLKEKAPKKEDKLRRLRGEKYKILAEKEAISQENEHLKSLLNQSLTSGTYHYGKSAYADLERAKEYKKRAIEEGDIDALIEADITLTKALNTVNDLEKWASNEEYRVNNDRSSSPQNLQINQEIQHEIASDWLDNHSYLQPNSRNYDPKLANQVAGFVNQLDTNLAQNNQTDAYFSEDYFNTIEKYIASVQNGSPKNTRNLESASHVGGVRNSYASNGNSKSSSSPTQMILTADEKRMAYNAGVSEKDWLKWKLEDLKTGKRA